MNNLHIVGHSVGAHLGGIIARKVVEESNGVFKIKRISALDPAFAPYYPKIWNSHKTLNKNDADMVRK
jgi:Lipase